MIPQPVSAAQYDWDVRASDPFPNAHSLTWNFPLWLPDVSARLIGSDYLYISHKNPPSKILWEIYMSHFNFLLPFSLHKFATQKRARAWSFKPCPLCSLRTNNPPVRWRHVSPIPPQVSALQHRSANFGRLSPRRSGNTRKMGTPQTPFRPSRVAGAAGMRHAYTSRQR